MITIKARNVNDAFPLGMMFLRTSGKEINSQHGKTLEMPEPVSVCYSNPLERVLFNKERAINPFLHFFEPLWIIAGQNDVKFLSDIVSKFNNYSDNGTTLYGAYGRRMWSQFDTAVQRLRADPDDRQVVLTIRESRDMYYHGKDQPCNIAVACKVREGRLNIHVFNRSNDFIWGLAGANMPQFSVLQEYLAGHIGVEVGTYHQTTDSMHAYVDNPQWEQLKDTPIVNGDLYTEGVVKPYRLFTGCEERTHLFENDLKAFFDGFRVDFSTQFFKEVVSPMWTTFQAHKKEKKGLKYVGEIAADDWRFVTNQWLEERE